MPQVFWIIGQTQKWRDQEVKNALKGVVDQRCGVPCFLALVPSKRRARFFEDRLLGNLHSKPVWKPEIHLISELSEKIFEEEIGAQSDFRILRETERLVCVEEALRRAKDRLEYFTPLLSRGIPAFLQHYPGILQKLAGFLSFLKGNDLDDSFIERLTLDDFGNTGAKDNDLAIIHNVYTEILQQNHLLDHEDRIQRVTQFLGNQHPLSLLKNKDILVLDGLGFLNRLEEKFLLTFIERFKKIIISLDYHASPQDLLHEINKERKDNEELSYRFYRPLKSFVKSILAHSDLTHELKIASNSEENIPTCLSVFSSFQTITPVEKKTKEPDHSADKINIYPSGKRVEEIRFIARNIKHLVLDGISLKQIHVVFPSIEKYVPIIYEIFPEYGIPFSITRGLPLTSSPLAVVIRSILKIPQGFPREDLFHFFSSNLVRYRRDFDPGDFEQFLKNLEIGKYSSLMSHNEIMERYHGFCKEQKEAGFQSSHFDMATLDRYARKANIRGGEDVLQDWFIPLDRSYFASLYHSNFEKKEEQERIKRVYFLIIRQLYFLKKIQKEFNPLIKAKSPDEVLKEMTKIISFFGIPPNIVRRLQEMPDLPGKDRMFLLRRDIRILYKVFQILEELQRAFYLKRQIQREEDEENALDLVYRLLSENFRDRVILDPIEPDMVQVTETLEMRGIDFEYCFFGGLNAQDFPRLPPSDFILPDTPNAHFRILDTVDESRFLFCHVLKNSSKKVFLTYPRMDGHDELEKSSFLEDLEFFDATLVQKISKVNHEILSSGELETCLARFVNPGEKKWLVDFGFLLQRTSNSEHIQKAIQIELGRLNNQNFGPYDGIVEESGHIPSDPLFSYSQLEQFAACPQQYFYARYLGLEPLDEVTEELEADEFGTFVHEILESFYKQWMADGFKKIQKNNFNQSLFLMRNCAEDILLKNEKHNEYILWDRQKEKITTGLEPDFPSEAHPAGILRGFLNYELERSEEPWEPYLIEKRFGFGEDALRIDKIRLCGKIDRIDTQRNPTNPFFRIFDYKTGKIPESREMNRGLRFQIPIYLWALKEGNPESMFEGAYYSLRDPTNIEIKNPFQKNKFTEPYSDLVKNWMTNIAAQNQKGHFHYAFEEVRCRFCNYRYICRRDPNRLKRMESTKNPLYYIPKKNDQHHSYLFSFLNLQKKIQEVLEKKKTQKSPKLGILEAKMKENLQKIYSSLPEFLQKKYNKEFKETLNKWSNLTKCLK